MKLACLIIALLCGLSIVSAVDVKTKVRSALDSRLTHDEGLETSVKHEEDQKLIDFSGFTNVVNDGTGIFRPILPGVNVPSARDTPPNTPASGGDNNNEGEAAEPSPSEDSVCFPADAYVEIQNGFKKRIDQVNIGDRLHVGNGHYSPVFMFTHKISHVEATFVKLETEARRSVRLTPGHYLHVNGRLASAETVKPGDILILGHGQHTMVTNVSRLSSRGLYNPQTVHGNIVVDGILASTYTRAVQPTTAHALLAPLRALYDRLGLTTTCFDHGADSLVAIVPSGPQIA